MIEMKRPQSVEGLPVEDLFSQMLGTNQASPQQKQPRKIPVPVHHEPVPQQQQQYQWQQHHPQQMPTPQPTGFYPHQAASVPVMVEQQPTQVSRPAQRVKNSVNIPVRHVPTIGPSYQYKNQPGQSFSPPVYRDMERHVPVKIVQGTELPPATPVFRDVLITRQDPGTSEDRSGPVTPRSPAPGDAKKRPNVRKQTSLVVSDDHTTPIPMPCGQIEAEHPILEQEESQTAPVMQKKQYPRRRKRTSLVVSDDHTTPIPMPYEQVKGERSITEEGEENDDDEDVKEEEPKDESFKKHPSIRKQTSLIVSDDRSTPIPMPYEQLSPPPEEDEDAEEEDLDDEPDAPAQVQNQSEDAPYIAGKIELPEHQSVDTEDEESADGNQSMSSSAPVTPEVSGPPHKPRLIPIKVINSPTSIHKPAEEVSSPVTPLSPGVNVVPIKVLRSPNSPKSPIENEGGPVPRSFPNLSQAREIPITFEGAASTKPAQRQGRVEAPSQPSEYVRGQPTVSQGPVRPGPSMPQPEATSTTGNAPGSQNRSAYTEPKPPAPVPKPKWVDPRITSSLETIQKITEEAGTIGQQVDSLQVTSKDRSYLMLEEQLTKLLLKLDSIESMGDEDLRSKRKACIKHVQQTLDALELKLIGS